MKPSIGAFTAELFEGHVGQHFLFQAAEQTDVDAVALELVEVTRYRKKLRGPASVESGRDPFALLFRSVTGRTLADGLQTMIHAEFDRCELFLQRVQLSLGQPRDDEGVYYEAVFN